MRAPNLGPLNSLLCAIGWHRRGRNHARVKGRARAQCRSCRKMLEKNRFWRLVR